MLDTALFLMCSTVTDCMTSGNAPKPKGNSANSGLPTSGNFLTGEGVLSLGVNEEHQFRRFAKVVGRHDLLEDEHFMSLKARQQNGEVVKKTMSAILLTRSAIEWETLLLDSGVPASTVKTVPEILGSEHIRQRNILTSFDAIHGNDRPVTVLKAPFKYGSNNGPALNTPPPRLGEDTSSVLEGAGYSDKQIAGFFTRKIVA